MTTLMQIKVVLATALLLVISDIPVVLSASPPFWLTMWFKSLTVFAMLVLLNSAYTYRVKLLTIKTKLLEAEGTKMARLLVGWIAIDPRFLPVRKKGNVRG